MLLYNKSVPFLSVAVFLTKKLILRRPLHSFLCLISVAIFFGLFHHFFIGENSFRRRNCDSYEILREKYLCLYRQNGFKRLDHILNYTVEQGVFLGESRPHRHEWITVTTHTTVDRLHHIIQLSDHWDGPVSVAVFTPGEEVIIARSFITFLRNTIPNIRENFSFHFLHVSSLPASQVKAEVVDEGLPALELLDVLLSQRSSKFMEERQRLWLPLNHCRNVALKFVETNYILLLDVDILPLSGLHKRLVSLVGRIESYELIQKPWALVLPTYEIEKGLDPPNAIDKLMTNIKMGKARQIHQIHFPPCQQATNHKKWEEYIRDSYYTNKEELHIAYKVQYEPKYEPYYVAKLPIPKFSEKIVGYCKDKSSQAYSMSKQGYHHYVIDHAFNTHDGMEIFRPADWMIQCQLNILVFTKVVQPDIDAKSTY